MSSVPTFIMDNGQQIRLGRIPPKAAYDYGPFRVVVKPDDTKVVMPRLGAFYSHADDKAPPPEQVDYWTKAIAAVHQMNGNDQFGDCCIAMLAHTVGLWTGNDLGNPALATTNQVVNTYHKVCGPGDNGCVVTDVMDAWKQGVQIGDGLTHSIDDYVAIDWSNKALVQAALDIFGSIQLGVSLPSAWTKTDIVWKPAGGNVGGHCVPCGAYGSNLTNSKGSPFGADGVSIATWAGLALITWDAFLSKQWIGEAYVPLSKDWYGADNLSPNGINVAGLQAAFQAIKSGQVPDVPAPPAVIDWMA